MEISQKIKNRTILMIQQYRKDTWTLMFTAALLTIAKTWKQPKCLSIDEWTKVVCVYTMDYYSATKKNEILPSLTSWMQLETIMLSEISQTEKEIYHMISLICGISKKKTDKWTNTVKQNYRYTEQSGICQRERRRKEIVEGDYQVQTFSCKINESWVWNVQCG